MSTTPVAYVEAIKAFIRKDLNVIVQRPKDRARALGRRITSKAIRKHPGFALSRRRHPDLLTLRRAVDLDDAAVGIKQEELGKTGGAVPADHDTHRVVRRVFAKTVGSQSAARAPSSSSVRKANWGRRSSLIMFPVRKEPGGYRVKRTCSAPQASQAPTLLKAAAR